MRPPKSAATAYVFKPPRPLAVIDAELKIVTDRILTLIGGLSN
jgi:type I restriction enzyme M protein